MPENAQPAPVRDPYQYSTEDVAAPPRNLLAIMRCVGPGMIPAASIVGSRELR